MPLLVDLDPSRLRLTLSDAVSRVVDSVRAVADVECDDATDAIGRIVARAVCSAVNLPPADASAMDGFACRLKDLPGPLNVTSAVYAETGEPAAVGSGECARIMTGGAVPAGADVVVIREDTTEDQGVVMVTGGEARAGQHIRKRGESLSEGEIVVAAGRRLSAADVGLIGSAGTTRIEVFRRPRVVVFATGSELVRPGDTLLPGQIYESNTAVLAAYIREMGCEVSVIGPINDDPKTLEAAVRDAAAEADAVITSGGVSVGDHDWMPQILAALGEVVFWKAKIKPGMPFLFGLIDGRPLFGLPGNPVSSAVTLLKLVRPGLEKMTGADVPIGMPRVSAILGFEVAKDHDRVEFIRVRLVARDNQVFAESTGSGSSARLRSLSDADGLIELPEGPVRLRRDETVLVEVLPRGLAA